MNQQVLSKYSPDLPSSNHSDGYIRDKSYSDVVSSPSMPFPLTLPSPSVYHCSSQRKDVLYMEDKKFAYGAVLVLVMTQYSVLSHKLICDDLSKIYLHYPHSASSALLTFSLFLFKSYSSFKASSVTSSLLHEVLSITHPPHSELKIPTCVPIALEK